MVAAIDHVRRQHADDWSALTRDAAATDPERTVELTIEPSREGHTTSVFRVTRTGNDQTVLGRYGLNVARDLTGAVAELKRMRDHLADRPQGTAGAGDTGVLLLLESVQVREDLLEHLAEAFDLELLELASARVRERVAPRTWAAPGRDALEPHAERISHLGSARRVAWRTRRSRAESRRRASSQRALHPALMPGAGRQAGR